MPAKLVSVNVGIPGNIAWSGRTVYTAIWKTPIEGTRTVGKINVIGLRSASSRRVAFFGLPLIIPGFGGANILQEAVMNRLGYVAASTIIITVLIALIFGLRSTMKPAQSASFNLGHLVPAATR